LLQSDPRVAPWVPVGVMGLTLVRNPRKTPNGVATCHAVRSAGVLGFGALGTSAVGGRFRWFLRHWMGAGRPVLARRAAPKTTTEPLRVFQSSYPQNFVKGQNSRTESDRSSAWSTQALVDFINAGFMARGYCTELAGCRAWYVLFGSR